MENNFKDYTPTELLHLGKEIYNKHESLKNQIIELTKKIDEIEDEINVKINELNLIESIYKDITEEIEKR